MTVKYLIPTILGCALLAAIPLRAKDKEKVEVDFSKLPPAATKSGLTYEADVKPLIEKHCLKCHSGKRPKSKYSMETLEGLIKGGKSKDAAIIPGKSDKSPIVWYTSDAVEDMEMPPLDKREKYPALTKDEIGLIRAWIDQGAK
jgi:Planctomycete cytochrome C